MRGTGIAPSEAMTEDARLEWASKLWLLAIAIVHWIVFFAMVYSHSSSAHNQVVTATSQYASTSVSYPWGS